MSELPAPGGVESTALPAQSGPIYIGGLDRSGKTTMRAFLASHPRIAIPAVGSNMWTYFYGHFGDLDRSANFERCLDVMLRYKHVRFLDPDPDRIRRGFSEGPHTYAHLFSLFLIDYAEREGKPRWGAQTGLIERYADHLFEAYEGLKVIHMVRDPRDRYEASLALWPDGKGRAGGATARWRYSVRLAERNLSRYPGDYLLVRFEDLISSPEPTLRKVCSFIGETFRPEMLMMPGALKHRELLLSGANGTRDGSPLSGAFIGRFRGRVAPGDVAFIQLHTGALMRAYGYAPEHLGFGPARWAAFAVSDWPNQMFRMVAWRWIEAIQHRFPSYVGRRPRREMILDAPMGSAP